MVAKLGLERDIVDRKVYENSVRRFAEAHIRLPTFAELTEPGSIPPEVAEGLSATDPDAPHSLNLFRVHWFNARDRRTRVSRPEHIVLPEALTGVKAPIVVLLGDRFPLIAAHKVLAAYGVLAPRIVTGQFDPTAHRAVWPSTGNYCRGGIAISHIMRCRGVAVLPEGMSRERFDWLSEWIDDPEDIIRTPGSESNVKEIYDTCNELERDPKQIIFNQFSEFGNHLAHLTCTGPAAARVFEDMRDEAQQAGAELRLRAFVSATGSAGTLGAGDYLKDRYGSLTVALEALECPTMLLNGFGAHNIQGIGDKHVPLIHNVMATDLVAAISDHSTDSINVLFNSAVGRRYLEARRKIDPPLIAELRSLGLSSLCNILGSIKLAKYLDLGSHDVIVTVATDGAGLYKSEYDKAIARYFLDGFDEVAAGEVFGQYLLGMSTDNMLELTSVDKARIFNLGYYTWVEQQGVPLERFEARRQPEFWRGLRDLLPAWDAMIQEFNTQAGTAS